MQILKTDNIKSTYLESLHNAIRDLASDPDSAITFLDKTKKMKKNIRQF